MQFLPWQRELVIARIAAGDEFISLEDSYVHHPSGDRIEITPNGFTVVRQNGESTEFADLSVALDVL